MQVHTLSLFWPSWSVAQSKHHLRFRLEMPLGFRHVRFCLRSLVGSCSGLVLLTPLVVGVAMVVVVSVVFASEVPMANRVPFGQLWS